MLYVGGKCVGKLPEPAVAAVLAERAASGGTFELRDEGGERLGEYLPEPTLDLPREEIERRLAGEFVSTDELKRRLGWQ